MPSQIILASTSPRRMQIMQKSGIPFKAVKPAYQEKHIKNVSAKKLVVLMARGKLKSVIKKYPKSFIITADTMVEFGGKTLGKPKSKKHAREMLMSYRGRRVRVFTGFAVYNPHTGREKVGCSTNTIYFKNYSENELENYITSKEPFGKAGAHAPQGLGMRLVKRLTGDKTSALGLPIKKVKKILRNWKAI